MRSLNLSLSSNRSTRCRSGVSGKMWTMSPRPQALNRDATEPRGLFFKESFKSSTSITPMLGSLWRSESNTRTLDLSSINDTRQRSTGVSEEASRHTDLSSGFMMAFASVSLDACPRSSGGGSKAEGAEGFNSAGASSPSSSAIQPEDDDFL
eukprot:CAMPEP_0167793326 /NCGR_PEP_ID=MMETSP0111_2-20121227/13103_1 /TAXON_ID=91324 /ORGANISM="Lotharella globosa, Strain CCCM811" /LENGTH=151 /DNA_ID=CAMNT_0007686441 /DNA_START=200 /DNA_END=655 /DNA_ORIENTATION=-